jgi:hypothetical protein
MMNSRDVTWFNSYHKAWIIKNASVLNYVSDDEVGSFIHRKADDIQESHADSTTQVYTNTANLKVYPRMRRLESNFNPDALTIIANFKQGRHVLLDQASIALVSGNIIEESTTFDEAWKNEDQVDQEKWRNAIKEEFNNIEDKKV